MLSSISKKEGKVMDCYLAQGELIRLEGGKEGLELYCKAGGVWMTKGDGVDYLIHAGSRLVLLKGEKALVEALKASDICLDKPSAAKDVMKPVLGWVAC